MKKHLAMTLLILASDVRTRGKNARDPRRYACLHNIAPEFLSKTPMPWPEFKLNADTANLAGMCIGIVNVSVYMPVTIVVDIATDVTMGEASGMGRSST